EEDPGPAATATPSPAGAPVEPRSRRLPSRVVLTASTIAIAFGATGIATVAWWSQLSKHALQEPRHINSFGVFPTLSRDGKLLAYMSSLGAGPPHIWVQ